MRNLEWLVAAAFGALTYSMTLSAAPITVEFQVANARGFINPIGQFTAPSVTFRATGDTKDLFSPSPGVTAFPISQIEVSVPAITHGTVTVPGMTASALGGTVQFQIPLIPFVFAGVRADDPALIGYSFQSSFGPSNVQLAFTYNQLPTSGQFTFIDDNGQQGSIGGASFGDGLPGVLAVSVSPPAPVPTVTDSALIALVLLMAGVVMWRQQFGKRGTGPPSR
jgi:hypothetical protein